MIPDFRIDGSKKDQVALSIPSHYGVQRFYLTDKEVLILYYLLRDYLSGDD